MISSLAFFTILWTSLWVKKEVVLRPIKSLNKRVFGGKKQLPVSRNGCQNISIFPVLKEKHQRDTERLSICLEKQKRPLAKILFKTSSFSQDKKILQSEAKYFDGKGTKKFPFSFNTCAHKDRLIFSKSRFQDYQSFQNTEIRINPDNVTSILHALSKM